MTTCAVLALKPLFRAKSRLTSTTGPLRARLALAMALDTITALTHACDEVLVVSGEPTLAGRLAAAELQVTLVDERHLAGLNHALAHGATLAADRHDTVLACVADLPGLTGASLHDLLTTTGPGRWFVPDLESRGTTMLLARDRPLDPLFEGASAERHRASGALPVLLPDNARADVDTLDDLSRLNHPGPHTCELMLHAGLR